MTENFAQDVEDIRRIPAVRTILEVVCRSTGMGFAAVARVTPERWIACEVQDNISFGLGPGGELKIESTICHEIRQNRQPVVIDHVANDPHYKTHHTPLTYGLQSYISMPIILSDDSFFGTLCAIDPNPASVNTPETIGMFKLFAELIAFHLNATRDLAKQTAEIQLHREDANLREQFIAVLGHDLRNPLSAISSSAQILKMLKLGDKADTVSHLISQSVLRMSGLIDNVLDFARGRLGGGLTLERSAEPLEPVLRQVIAELESSDPERKIDASIDLTTPLNLDHSRIAQLFSNLLGNAFSYGNKDEPIRITAHSNEAGFILTVANGGDPIPASSLEHLFHPFVRGGSLHSQQGLGLGLYIASEIARAHGGTLVVKSDAIETKFTLNIPK